MLDYRGWLRTAALASACLLVLVQGAHAAPAGLSAEALDVLAWIRDSRDAGGKPFAVVDKRAARIYVFAASGELAGQSPVLLGSAPGDHTLPGVSERTQLGTLRPEDRTTPAGRFEAEPGVNSSGEAVVWVDYESAFAIHRLRPGFAFKARAERLATLATSDKRVSWGCVVVPVAFYEQVVQRVLGNSSSVVYVLPETRPLRAVFTSFQAR